MKNIIYVICWMVGFLIISYYYPEVKAAVSSKIAITFNPNYYAWLDAINAALGMYIAILLVNLKRVRINHAILMAVTIPTLLIAVVQYFMFIPLAFDYTSVVCGFSLIVALFERRQW